MTWTREEVRTVDCPKCRAAVGGDCAYTGKGAAKKMRLRSVHQARVDAFVQKRRRARAQSRQRSDDFMLIDDGDKP